MSRVAAALLALAAIVHLVLGVSAIAGAERLEANVREIETSAVGGELYFALGTIGAIMSLVAILELVAAGLLQTRGARGRLLGMIAGYLAMGVVFWTLPIFRWASVATVALLFASAYLLTYRVGEPA
ncbi:MAG: hypothetical protein M3Y34_02675 [Actinomycetota bacterium]|nr:hypothetical protein [Actinomycetota bacterium]